MWVGDRSAWPQRDEPGEPVRGRCAEHILDGVDASRLVGEFVVPREIRDQRKDRLLPDR